MSLHRRLAALEKKRKAFDPPKEIGVIGGDYMQMIFDPENPGHLIWPEPPGGFPAFALTQQSRLLRELAEYEAQLDNEGNTNVAHTSPNETGEAPLKPGEKRSRYLFSVEGGVETQLDRLTGERMKIGRI